MQEDRQKDAQTTLEKILHIWV